MNKIIILILIASLFTSCNLTGMWKDENIDSETLSKIHKLNDKIIEGFIENNQEQVFNVCSKELIKEGRDDLSSFISQTKGKFSKDNFKILNDFHLKNTSDNIQSNVMTGVSNKNDYNISFKALNSEMFVSVGYFDNDIDQTCLTLIYGKYGDSWKLNIMQVGLLKIMNKDAIDWYNTARLNFKKGYLIDALNNLNLAKKTLNPANKFWKYQIEDEISNFGDTIITKIYSTYTFPLTIENIKTKPEIFNIYLQEIDKGYFPMIQYLTSIDLKDTLSLSNECDMIHSNIEKIFNGIKVNNKMIFYKASNSIPTENSNVENYGFIRNNN